MLFITDLQAAEPYCINCNCLPVKRDRIFVGFFMFDEPHKVLLQSAITLLLLTDVVPVIFEDYTFRGVSFSCVCQGGALHLFGSDEK